MKRKYTFVIEELVRKTAEVNVEAKSEEEAYKMIEDGDYYDYDPCDETVVGLNSIQLDCVENIEEYDEDIIS